MTPMQKRLQALELARGVGQRGGGVVRFDPFTETAQDSVDRMPPGAYLLVPTPMTAETWEAAVAPAQARLRACAGENWTPSTLFG